MAHRGGLPSGTLPHPRAPARSDGRCQGCRSVRGDRIKHLISQSNFLPERCAEIVRNPCRKEHDRKVFHAHRGEKNASVFTAKVSDKYVPHGKGFWQHPPRHATRYARLKTLVRLCITIV